MATSDPRHDEDNYRSTGATYKQQPPSRPFSCYGGETSGRDWAAVMQDIVNKGAVNRLGGPAARMAA